MEAAHYKAIAIRQGVAEDSLVRRKLTYTEFSAMNEAEKNYHLVQNSQAVDKALAEHEKEVRDAVSHAKREVQKVGKFEVEDPIALGNLMIENGGKFSEMFPQFVGSRKNTDRVLKYLRENELLPEVENFIVAFQALAHEGEISIDPSKTGLTQDSTELTGSALQEHPNLAHLLTRVTPQIFEQRSVMRMDAKSLAAWEREKNGPPEVPYVIKRRIDQAFVTLADKHPEFKWNIDANKTKLLAHLNAHATTIDSKNVEAAFVALKNAGELSLNENVVVRGEFGTITDFSQIEPKHLTDKQESLGNKIARMDAEEFREFLSHPANRRAVDNLR
jgi:hypothetical protein